MKQFLTVLFLVFVYSISFGQEKFKEGGASKVSTFFAPISAVFPENDKDEFILLSSENKGLKLIKKLRVYGSDFFLKEKLRRDNYIDIIQTKNKVFATFFEGKSLMISEFDLNTYDVTGPQKDIIPGIELKSKSKFKASLTSLELNNLSVLSHDKKLIGFVAAKKENEIPVISYTVYNENLDLLLSNTIRVDVKFKNFSIRDFQLSNEGQLMIVSQEKDSKNKKESFIHLTLIEPDGSMKEYDLTIGKEDTYAYVHKKNNKFYLSAIEQEDKQTIITQVVLDEQFNEVSNNTSILSKEDYKAKNPKFKFKKKDWYELKNILSTDKYTLIIQQHVTHVYKNGRHYSTDYADMLLHGLDDTGKVIWAIVIPRKEFGVGLYTINYDPKHPAKTRLVYNGRDEVKIMTIDNATGDYSTKAFLHTDELYANPSFDKTFSKGNLIYSLGYLNKARNLIRLNLDAAGNDSVEEETQKNEARKKTRRKKSSKKRRRKKRK